jgi:phosphoglycerate dehydrogenase-like enzyme
MANIFTVEDLARLRGAADVVWARDEPMPKDEIEKVREEVIAIITGRWRHGDISRFPNIRAVLEVSGGFPSAEDLNYATCFSRGIRVLSCAPAFGPAVAEMGLALALACCRQVAWTDAAFRGGEPNWSHTSFETEIGHPFTLCGKQAGFIGFGGLARSLKPLLEPSRCPIQVYDPWLTDAFLRAQGVTPVDLDTLLSTSRFIFVLAVPSTSNRAMLNRERLRLIRRDAVLLLLSRAHVVDFDALTDMLAQGRFRAGIDVFPEEPLPGDHPIRRVKHAVLSSHRAGAIGEALLNIGRMVADDIEAICQGLVPQQMQVAQPEFIRLRGT